MRYATILLSLLVSCGDDGKENATVYASPNGVLFFMGTGMEETTTVEVGSLIDLRASQWIAEKTYWGCGSFTDAHLWNVARSVPIKVWNTASVVGDGRYPYAGYNFYGDHIDITWPKASATCVYDPPETTMNYDTDAGHLFYLKHELNHSALGDWHPK